MVTDAPSLQPTHPPVIAFAMTDELRHRTFSDKDLARLATVAQVAADLSPDRDARIELTLPAWARPGIEVLITGWGTPALTPALLDQMPDLRCVVHSAGTVKSLLPQPFWGRGVAVSCAADANAVPVAEYAVAMIVLAGKAVLPISSRHRRERTTMTGLELDDSIGNFGTRVGLIAFSRIGRRVAELLRPFDVEVVVHDPYADPAAIRAVGATPIDLDELCASSDVISLHAPSLPQTRHLIDARLLNVMRPGATLINTSRGALVDTDALTDAVLKGHVRVVLDVTDPELLPADSPLWEHDNATITPHLAGSLGRELRRLGASVVDEIARISAGDPLAHPVREADLGLMA